MTFEDMNVIFLFEIEIDSLSLSINFNCLSLTTERIRFISEKGIWGKSIKCSLLINTS